jgi:Rps23 Pro-64 3,4-dihydroxylase Tpa1-like proline 4-hydroxylase
MTAFALSSDLDADAAAKQFANGGRVQVAPFLLPEAAEGLRAHLLAREDWREVLNSGETPFEIDRAGQRSLSPEDRARLDSLVHAAAKSGFQYRYETLRVPDDAEERRKTPGDALLAFTDFLSSEPVLELLRRITGFGDIDFADAQATAYRPGDFLTTHDDGVEGKNRKAAYVFGLTPTWRTEWGGLLLFHDELGDVERGLLPRFNALNIFSVPQRHSVSAVAPFAGEIRLSVTGWLRALGASRG